MSLLGIEAKPIVINDSVDSLSHFREFSSGAGANIVKSNNEGFFAGATNFTDAPFSVDYDGHLKAESGVFSGKIFAGATNFADAPFSVDYDGNLKAESGVFSGKIEIKDGSGNVVILIDPNG